MLNIGPGEILLILVAALLILGPQKLPELARGIGKALRQLRRQTDEVRSVVEREFYRMEEEAAAKQLPPSTSTPHPILPPPSVPELSLVPSADSVAISGHTEPSATEVVSGHTERSVREVEVPASEEGSSVPAASGEKA